MLLEGDYMSSVDISNAYRAVSIHPHDRDKQGVSWRVDGNKRFFKDNRLCMGLRSSPYVFSKLSDFITRCMVREGVTRVTNYLDDFAIVTDSYVNGCIAQKKLIAVIRRMGFYVNFKKLVSPSTKIRFLGIDIDSVSMVITLPDDKLKKMHRSLRAFSQRTKCSKQELEVLAGGLAHCCKVVRGGRTFSRRIYDMCNVAKKSHFKIRLNNDFRLDINWWLEFMEVFNGQCAIRPPNTCVLSTYSDSSTSGFGATHQGDWVAGVWAADKQGGAELALSHHFQPPVRECYDTSGDIVHINTLEMYPVVVAARRWGGGWGGHNVCFITDNTQVMHCINTGRSKNKTVMAWLRNLFWEAVVNNFTAQSVYIQSAANTVCDALSRLTEPSANRRLLEADSSKRLCCNSTFKQLIL